MTPKQYAALPMRKLVSQLTGSQSIPADLYPPGWIERAERLERGGFQTSRVHGQLHLPGDRLEVPR